MDARVGAQWLYLTYGVMSGTGAGMAYVTPLAAVSKWFPEQRGLVGGLVVSGFGVGTFFYNEWIPRLAGCGGGFGIMPSYCAQYFGTRYMGRNYGLVRRHDAVDGYVSVRGGTVAFCSSQTGPEGAECLHNLIESAMTLENPSGPT